MKTRLTIVFSLALTLLYATASGQDNTQLLCQCDSTIVLTDTLAGVSAGERVLQTGFLITQLEKKVIKGSCWDFVNEVFRRANFVESKKTIFRSAKGGPYAPSTMVKPGDWVYHINHQYNNIEHSAIFVCWKDFKKKTAITLSYAGMNRNVTGKYGEYNLSSIYSIFRPTETTPLQPEAKK